MKNPAQVVLLALVVYVGLGAGGTFGMIRPKLDQEAALLQQKKAHEETIAKFDEDQRALDQAHNSKDSAQALLEAYRAVKMPRISFTGGELYALQGLLFEQREDLGPVVINALTLTGNEPEHFELPAPDTKAVTRVEPLPIPQAPFDVTFVGTFSSMLEFLRGLAAAPRLLAVGGNFRMEVTDSGFGEERLRVTVPLQEFTFARGAEGKFAAPAAPAAGAGPPGPAPAAGAGAASPAPAAGGAPAPSAPAAAGGAAAPGKG